MVVEDDDDVGIAAAVNGTEDDEKEEEVDEVDEEDAVLLFLGNAFDNLLKAKKANKKLERKVESML